MQRTKAFGALLKPRGGKPVNMDELAGILVRFSQLVVRHPEIREIEINPLLASADGIIALDGRIVIAPAGATDAETNRPAIRPYPQDYIWESRTSDGSPMTIRPLRPEDEPLLVHFHERLSDETVRLRYFDQQKLSHRTSHERLIRSCFLDYDRQIALSAITGGEHPVLAGVARLIRKRKRDEAEFTLIVADDVRRLGIGSELMRRLMEVANAEGIVRVTAIMLNENHWMQTISRKMGFVLEPWGSGCMKASIEISQ
jgi:acetyltransferase